MVWKHVGDKGRSVVRGPRSASAQTSGDFTSPLPGRAEALGRGSAYAKARGPRTPDRGPSCRGFSYIEMLAILGLTALISAILMPDLVQSQANRDVRMFKIRICAMVGKARSQAIETGSVIALAMDKSAGTVQEFEQTKNGEVTLQELALPTGITATHLVADKNESTDDGWRLSFYADGGSSGGGIEFDDNGKPFSFVVANVDGQAKIVDGPMPDLSLERWGAGSYEGRS